MKYYVEIDLTGQKKQLDYTALTKARADVITTLDSCGWKELLISGMPLLGRKMSKAIAVVKAFFLSITLKRSDTLLFQYPDYSAVDIYIIRFFKRRGIKVVTLIHDLDHFRSDWRTWDAEKAILNQSDYIYVHTPSMLDYMVKGGMDEKKLVPIYLFDYYSKDEINPIDEREMYTIAYAGNLVKSTFIKGLASLFCESTCKINLYGNCPDESVCSESVRYCGRFSPEHTGKIHAGWGLVWDGDNVDTCSGRYGDYLRYNSSHKMSLYLSCGIPLIVWTESSLSKWITDRGLGIAVKSIDDIPETISSIGSESYHRMLSACSDLGLRLRVGYMLKTALSNMAD